LDFISQEEQWHRRAQDSSQTLRSQGVAVTLHPVPEKRRVFPALPADSDPLRRALQENEDWYRDLVAHSRDLLCIHDLNGRLLSVNPEPARVLGYSVEELLQIPMRDLVVPEFRDEFDAYLSQIARLGEARGFLALMTRSGERRIWEYHNTLRSEGVQAPVVRGMARDVTEQKRSDKQLRETGEQLLAKVRESEKIIRDLKLFRTLVDRSTDAILVVNAETLHFLDANETACTQLGYSREEFLSLRVFDINPTVDEHSSAQTKAKLKESGFVAMEGVHRRKDGSTFPVELNMTRVELDRSYVVTIARDLTERKRVEEALQKSEEKFSKVFRRSPVSIAVTKLEDSRFVEVNETFESITGWRRDEVLGRTPFEIDLWVNPEERVALGKRLLAEGGVREVEARIRIKDGAILTGLVTAEVIELYEERCAIIAFADITERRQAQEALRDSEQKYRNFVSRSWEGIFREEMEPPLPVDLPEEELVHHLLRDAYIAECNDALAAMYGLQSAEELRGRAWHEMMPPEDPRNIEMTRQFIREGFRLREHESHEIDVYGNPKIILNSQIGTVENGKLVRTWGVQRDITEKVKAEQARSAAEESLRQAVQQLARVSEELRLAKEKLAEENLYLEQTIDTELGFGEIIGRSPALVKVMEKVARVAPSDATALLLGETGTGKELIARALHRLSQRQGNSFIKVNCAAIPSGLLESELFGHEKGAFTGATSRKLGRVELADNGTLFLDEIGEIPLSLQPKLLRVLQDQEFERLGGTQTLKVNFRLLAATNRDLMESVKAREFRSDLYYRLNVFPILIPPLRDRREDVRPLIEHFVRKFSVQMKKSIISIPAKTMEVLVRWEWPGNIRELENFVERSVILTTGPVLQAPLFEFEGETGAGAAKDKDSIAAREREQILRALRECHGRLGGADGAAARLGLKRTTLQSKLDHLGIKPGAYRA
jgi:PAS domain S-box-containing protein